jgi:hypothetical protein
MKAFIGGTLMIVGLMLVAGASGDCDGKCMDQANTLPQMLGVSAAGLVAMVVGFLASKDAIRG